MGMAPQKKKATKTVETTPNTDAITQNDEKIVNKEEADLVNKNTEMKENKEESKKVETKKEEQTEVKEAEKKEGNEDAGGWGADSDDAPAVVTDDFVPPIANDESIPFSEPTSKRPRMDDGGYRRNSGYGGRDGGYNDRGSRDYNAGGGRDRGYGAPRDSGYGAPRDSYGSRDRGYGAPRDSYGSRDRGYGARDSGYGGRDSGYNSGYQSRDREFGERPPMRREYEQVPEGKVLGLFGVKQSTQEELEDFLKVNTKSPFTEIRVIFDKVTRNPRGFAFVYFETVEESTQAKADLEGKTLNGFNIRVDYSKKDISSRPPRTDF